MFEQRFVTSILTVTIMIKIIKLSLILISCFCNDLFAYNSLEQNNFAGPISSALRNINGLVPDAGVAGFVGPSGLGVCPAGDNDEEPTGEECDNYVNPVFSQWAAGYVNYIPAPAADPQYIGNEQNVPTGGVPEIWRTPLKALGPVIGDNFDVCVLGDLWQIQLDVMDLPENQLLQFNDPNKIQPGQITLSFAMPFGNHPGPDFAVFENGSISGGLEGEAGEIMAELAYVEVSSDGVNFVRFPSVSLTESNIGAYGTIDPSNVYNLAGKHVNAYQSSWGTPFDLNTLAANELVLNNVVDLDNISYVRIVDIPGNGYYMDSASLVIDPNSLNSDAGPSTFAADHPVHDAWLTWGSGGFDLDAIGVISSDILGDANLDGKVDLEDLLTLYLFWNQKGYWSSGDFNSDNQIDESDLLILAENWLRDMRTAQ